MLSASYPARYRDDFGEEKTLIRNNGQEIESTQVVYCCPEFTRRSPDHYGI